ncbi:hypothetical protein [Streptosporangium sp. NPDC023615]|uniref:hypothetical protein n=1 Tax=Streptosporangium sp. NPDC023615 TaxID=3154794 RepID=UPI0034396415
MHTRTITTVAALGLLATLTTAGAATASVSVAPAPCAQEHLALLNAEDALVNVDARPEVKAAHAALVKAGGTANVEQLSQRMALQELGIKTPSLDASTKKAVDAYNTARTRYVQVREATLLKIAPQRQNARNALKRCLTMHAGRG